MNTNDFLTFTVNIPTYVPTFSSSLALRSDVRVQPFDDLSFDPERSATTEVYRPGELSGRYELVELGARVGDVLTRCNR
jgi:hypothetical protein